ncbi:MAG: DUF922 domain-containing protein [Hyphomicrobiaceae bacterium]|nr:DUF922 domain-containing protein [Hyphomicrobiaceae bacterium]
MAMAVLIGALMAVPGVFAGPAQAQRLTDRLEERAYRVRGLTARTLVGYMRAYPFPGDYGAAMANIRPRYDLRVETQSHGAECRVRRVDLDIHFVMTLPEAVQEDALGRTARRHWQRFSRFARAHELYHRQIYLGCARRFLRAARRMREAGCRALERAVRQALSASEEACEAQHLAFDRREAPRLQRLSLFRAARAEGGPIAPPQGFGFSAALALGGGGGGGGVRAAGGGRFFAGGN